MRTRVSRGHLLVRARPIAMEGSLNDTTVNTKAEDQRLGINPKGPTLRAEVIVHQAVWHKFVRCRLAEHRDNLGPGHLVERMTGDQAVAHLRPHETGFWMNPRVDLPQSRIERTVRKTKQPSEDRNDHAGRQDRQRRSS